VDDYSGFGPFRVGFDGATDEAGRLDAVVAAHREVMPLGVRIVAAFDFADATPVEVRGVAVLFIAGDDAALAADALRHIEVEAVLFTRPGLPMWDRARESCLGRTAYSLGCIEQRAFQ
jgi:hypothetical protein